jgi:hypothetical protein
LEHEEIVTKILDQLGWYYDDTARKKHGSFKGWTKGELISLIITYGSGPHIAKALGYGEQSFNRTVKEHLVPIFGGLNGGGESWKNVLLNFSGIKWCPHCSIYKLHQEFYTDKSRNYGIDKVCTICKVILNRTNHIKYKIRVRKYISTHIHEYAARNAKRRATKLRATPIWADLERIKQIYKERPEGYHVDHIVPLQGKLACGLHCEFNLQYLTASDNIIKGNRFLPG